MNNISIVLNFLNRDQYQTYHRSIAKKLKSIDAAILFDEFVQRHIFHENRNELIEIENAGPGWFYHTREAIEDRTILTRYAQDKAIDVLKSFSLIETIKHGIPCKRYFRLNFDGIDEFLKNLSSLSTVSKQACLPSTNNRFEGEQTLSLYIEEPNKEPKERVRDKPSNSRTSTSNLKESTSDNIRSDKQHNIHYQNRSEIRTERNLHVYLSNKEHEELVGKYGGDLTQLSYERLSKWKQNTPKHKWKKVDKLAIENWVIDAVIEDKEKERKRKASGAIRSDSTAISFENKEWFKKISSSFFNKGRAQSIYLNDHFEYIQLADYKTDQQSDKIYFKDVKFREKLKNELTKRNLL